MAAQIEAQIGRGCYSCLESAFSAAAGPALNHYAYQIALLLAARSKELGLDPQPWLTHASQRLPGGTDWPVYLEIVESIPSDLLSGDREAMLLDEAKRRRSTDIYEGWRRILATGPGLPAVRTYLELAIVCRRQEIEGREAAVAVALAKLGKLPIIRYRTALCGGDSAVTLLAAVRAEDTDFIDADLELGRIGLQSDTQAGVEQALLRLQSARTAFPNSPVPPLLIAAQYERWEQWPEAEEMFENVLALVPTHRDALVGRTETLSHLLRHEEATATATKLIQLGNWFISEAHYWRAWNEYQLKNIQAARSDVVRAKSLGLNPATLILSGLIEWSDHLVELAEAEFQRALDMDYGQCEAAFYLGGVRAERRTFSQALEAYRHAEQCLDLAVALHRDAIRKLSDSDDATNHVREIASHKRQIDTLQIRRGQAQRSAQALQVLVRTVRP